jgi:hypothetical protein
MKKLLCFIIPLLFSCRDASWEVTTVNKFLRHQSLDTTGYSTLGELLQQGKITKITTADYNDRQNYLHYYYPLVSHHEFVLIEKDYPSDSDKNMMLKLNRDGVVVDSLVINKHAAFINDYIIEKDTYCSWLVDNDKRLKKLENINWFSESDTTKIKALVYALKRNSKPYYSTSEYATDQRVDTCNYVISFDSKHLVKYNYLKSISPDYTLKLERSNVKAFSKAISGLTKIPSEELFKVDDFYAETHHHYVPGNKFDYKLYPNGGGVPQCDCFLGSCFFTLATSSKLKYKMVNENICEKNDIHEMAKYHELYSEPFLNFYLLDDGYENASYYILKK